MKNRKRIVSGIMALLLMLGLIFSETNVTLAASKKMKVSSKKVTLQEGKTKKIKVKNAPKKAKITWKSKNSKIAKVSKKGKITAKKKGKTSVICKVTYKKNGKKKVKKFNISVKVTSKQSSSSQTPTGTASQKLVVTATPVPTNQQTSETLKPSGTLVPSGTSEPTGTPEPAGTPEPLGTPMPTENPKNNPAAFHVLSGDELIQDMGAGWNLGNTMDGHTGFTPGETIWQPYKTTKQLIKSVHDMGFNTVRIPVTWGTMIDDENDYAINQKWMSRVQDIVDYCVSLDMYAIINIHHDGAEQMGWLRIATDDQEALKEKFAGVWKNIATTFKNYDEHLILESMNEVRGENMTVVQENAVIMELNQIFVDTVRGTGSNNAQRYLMVPGKYNFIDSVCNEKNKFSLPNDSVENRLIVSVHDYSPWSFCGAESTATISASDSVITSNDNELKPLYDTYTSKGIPVVVGEYGCINKGNPQERAFYLEAMNRMFRKYKLVGVYWDQGWYDRSQKPADYSFTIIDRETGDPIEKVVTDAMLRGIMGLSGETDASALEREPQVIPVTSLELPVQEVILKMDEEIHLNYGYEPQNSNDVVLWKTEDPSVATVSYGTVHPVGIGKTTLTLFSQNSDQSVQIPVTVTAADSKIPCEEITVETENLQLVLDDIAWLNGAVLPSDSSEALSYRSGDESVVTVSRIGKVVAVGSGKTTIKIQSSGGKVKEIPVEVTAGKQKTDISLALNVYYNDASKEYYSNEESKNVITVNGDGQYTVTFDCDTDLSATAKEAGVDTINNVTAIYIKDHAVTVGNAEVSPLTACDIRYDEIVVDGTKLTINNQDFKSALKSSGIFDTNDPINAWDGSAVEEVKDANHVAFFTGITNPKKITVTFTLQNVKFKE